MTGKSQNRVTKSQEKENKTNALKYPDLTDRPVGGSTDICRTCLLQHSPSDAQRGSNQRLPAPQGQRWEHFSS